jgi:hypothetical protein
MSKQQQQSDTQKPPRVRAWLQVTEGPGRPMTEEEFGEQKKRTNDRATEDTTSARRMDTLQRDYRTKMAVLDESYDAEVSQIWRRG